MKKVIIITSIFFVCFIIPSVLVIAKNTAPADRISIDRNFKMDVYEDGKLTGSKISVHLQIYNSGGDKITVWWEHVYIRPLDFCKKIQLTPEIFSTNDGTIKNVKVTQNNFSFEIDIAPSLGRTIQVAGQTVEGKGVDIETTELWLSDISNKKTKIEWKSTDKIILPYNEVF